MEKISKRLNQALKVRNMKPIELSEKAKISKGAISSYLSGKYLPKSKYVYKMAKVLNVNPVWLLGYDVPMENNDSNNSDGVSVNSLDIFLNNIKYSEIEKIVKNDKSKKIISYISFYDIILYLFSNPTHPIEKQYEIVDKMAEQFEYVNDKIENATFIQSNNILGDKISKKDLEEDLLFAKKVKLLYFIKKYYTEEDILSEIDDRDIFNIVDENDNRTTDKAARLDAIKDFIEKLLNDFFNNKKNK